mmetsp:Transcript_38804/g.107835  ORF Transcript_38804/g.107835 Transcript_38804/m.107835 type:complete len:325 (-) Transcript_38804:241-1215(-)
MERRACTCTTLHTQGARRRTRCVKWRAASRRPAPGGAPSPVRQAERRPHRGPGRREPRGGGRSAVAPHRLLHAGHRGRGGAHAHGHGRGRVPLGQAGARGQHVGRGGGDGLDPLRLVGRGLPPLPLLEAPDLRLQPVVRRGRRLLVVQELGVHGRQRLAYPADLLLKLRHLVAVLRAAYGQLLLHALQAVVDLHKLRGGVLVDAVARGLRGNYLGLRHLQVVLNLDQTTLQLLVRLRVGLLQRLQLSGFARQVLLQPIDVLHHLLVRLDLLLHQARDLAVGTCQFLPEISELRLHLLGDTRGVPLEVRELDVVCCDPVADDGDL